MPASGRRYRLFMTAGKYASAIAVLTLLAVGFFLLHRSHPLSAAKAAVADPSAEDLEAVRALPYAQWDNPTTARLSGVTRYDPRRSAAGLNLYTNDHDEVYLIDMKG